MSLYIFVKDHTEKILLHQSLENTLGRALAYCLTVVTIYIVLLGLIIIYETYQVNYILTQTTTPTRQSLF